jgi:glutamate synthase domain-containing protein 2
MVEIKLSQGAKPGHGGVLPAAKITPEIADARGIEMGVDCIQPAHHSTFSTPIELMEFIARLREITGGKPTGFKLCLGHRWEFMAMLKAMRETGITPDFIVVDGKEGGTGAAPLEFTNHVGTPLVEGLTYVRNALIGAGLRDRIRLGASGKLLTAFDLVWAMAMGADWCNSARGFMFAVGCIQAQICHSNRCPVGVTTQDPRRVRALKALSELVGAAGFSHPQELQPWHLMIRRQDGSVLQGNDAFPILLPGELLEESRHADYAIPWHMASATQFAPLQP